MIPNANQIAVTLTALAVERLSLLEQLRDTKAKADDLQKKLEIADAEVTRLREFEPKEV